MRRGIETAVISYGFDRQIRFEQQRDCVFNSLLIYIGNIGHSGLVSEKGAKFLRTINHRSARINGSDLLGSTPQTRRGCPSLKKVQSDTQVHFTGSYGYYRKDGLFHCSY